VSEEEDGAARARENIKKAWDRDWGVLVSQVMEDTGLTRPEAFQWLIITELCHIRDHLATQARHLAFDPECQKCRDEKTLRDHQIALVKKAEQHLDEEHGPEDWEP
jgi:hypothetical protein